MPAAHCPQTSDLDALQCPYSDCLIMNILHGNLKCLLWISHQGQPAPQGFHWQGHPSCQWHYLPYWESPTEPPEPDGSITDSALGNSPKDTDYKHGGLSRQVPQPHSPAPESDGEEAVPRQTPTDKYHPAIEVHPMVGRKFSDNPFYNEFGDLIHNLG